MAYAITKQGRTRSEEIARASTRYAGPAPVSMAEYRTVLAEAAKPGTLDLIKVSRVLAGVVGLSSRRFARSFTRRFPCSRCCGPRS